MDRRSLSPKQVASALGISESTVKRWCDRGWLPAETTPGGHRRITLQAVLEFIQRRHLRLVRPEVLDLPSTTGKSKLTLRRRRKLLLQALLEGKREAVRRLLFDVLAAGHRPGQLADELIAPVMHRIGELWECQQLEIYRERLACRLLEELVYEWLAKFAGYQTDGQTAVGGTLEGDLYTLPALMVHWVLLENHWHSILLGSNLPAETLCQAIEQHKPRLFWLSISHGEDLDRLAENSRRIFEATTAVGSHFVLGGRAIKRQHLARLWYSSYSPDLRHFEMFLQTLSESRQDSALKEQGEDKTQEARKPPAPQTKGSASGLTAPKPPAENRESSSSSLEEQPPPG